MKNYKFRLLVYACLLVGIGFVVSFSCVSSWKQIVKNKQDKKALQAQYDKLVTKEDDLKDEVGKLQDPEYVAKYAREKYLYTKDGEIIVDLDE